MVFVIVICVDSSRLNTGSRLFRWLSKYVTVSFIFAATSSNALSVGGCLSEWKGMGGDD